MATDLLTDLRYTPLTKRGITEETCTLFKYAKAQKRNGEWVQVANYFDADGAVVAQKLRTADKQFAWLGDQSKALPFGAHLWKGGRKLVLTEGEIDALTVSQLQGNTWPVWSIACGAGPQVRKYIARHRDLFLAFDEVVIMFDADEPGIAAAKIAAEVIGSRARIATLPGKDPNTLLVEGRGKEVLQAMWSAVPYRPDGMVELAELRDQVLRGVEQGVPWPWQSLTEATYGRRLGEIYALGAGTGVGKTDVFTEIVVQTVRDLREPVGIFFLEQEPRETGLRIAGKLAGKRFHVPDGSWSHDELVAAFDTLTGLAPIYAYDSFGNQEWESIAERIRFLVHNHGVKHIFLDHLTALATWQDDERKALDSIMSEIGGMVKELGIALYLISHLATPEGTPHEEGGRVTIRHFRGSRAIGYWAHFMFALERNQQADDPRIRNLTTFRILKDRYTGQATGQTFHLTYDHATGSLVETDPTELEEGAVGAEDFMDD